jgi:hypothetical protein
MVVRAAVSAKGLSALVEDPAVAAA